MSNYSIVVNSTFQPFTYQELIAPIAHQQQVFDNLAEQYDKLSSQADILEAMGANDRDKGAYSRFKKYSDNLRAEADNLYRNGLNSESRMRLSELKRRYNSEIVPIQNAWNKREQEAEMQTKARLSNPMLRFTRDAASTSLDDYIANPTGGYGVINLANISSQMGAMAKNLTKMVRDGSIKDIDPYHRQYIEKYGLDANMIREWITNPSKNPTLTNMMNQVLSANGATPEALGNTPEGMNIMREASNAAMMGAWESIGQDKPQIYDNTYNTAMLDYTINQMKERDKAERAAASGDGNSMNILSDGMGIETAAEYDVNGREDLKKLQVRGALKAGYFGKVQGQVNAMKIYEEYQDALNKPGNAQEGQFINVAGNAGYRARGTNKEDIKKSILQKYQKYGVTDILSDRQYKMLKGMGYDSVNNNPSKARYSDLEKRFDSFVQAKSRYSTNMASYDIPDEIIRNNIEERAEYGQLRDGYLWEIDSDGKKGNVVKRLGKLDLYSKKNTKGNQVNGIYYDPEFAGHIVIRIGNKRYVANPDLLSQELTRAIRDAEAMQMPANKIAEGIAHSLNGYNKTASKTDKDA